MPATTPEQRRSFLKYLLIGLYSALAAIGGWGAARFAFFTRTSDIIREVPAQVLAKATPGVPFHVPKSAAWIVKPAADRDWRALDDRCTHLGCRHKWDASQGIFRCPCHGSEFDINGRVMRGPATRNIRELQVKIQDSGSLHLMNKERIS